RFKLSDDDFVRRLTLRQGDKTVSTVYVGSSSGVRRSDARTDRDHAVYAVDLATYQLPTQWSEWLGGDVLQREPTSVTELDVTTAKSRAPLKLVRETAPAPTPAAPKAAVPKGAAGSAAPAPAKANGASVTHWVADALPA